tara:strand:- start:90 stop:251 length:162 start_codon:yes stop_codon:yes gene_type:complete
MLVVVAVLEIIKMQLLVLLTLVVVMVGDNLETHLQEPMVLVAVGEDTLGIHLV